MRVLIVKSSSMGDVVHTLPVIDDIVQAHADAQIDWVVEEAFAPIVRMHDAVARVIPLGLRRWRRRPFSAATWREFAALRRTLRQTPYDHVIDCQGLIKSAVIARLARGPVTGFDASCAREPLAAVLYAQTVAVPRALHAIERMRRLMAAVMAQPIEGRPWFNLTRLPPVDEEVAAAMAGAPYAVLLTNASRPTKHWPDEHWALLGQLLAEQGFGVLLFAGSDAERIATDARAASMPTAQVAPPLPLDAIGALLAGAHVVIGLDTGLSHLAAALGRPTVGIFCDYDPALVGLVGDARCVSLGGVGQRPSVDEVVDALDTVLARRSDTTLNAVLAGSGTMPPLP